MLQRFQSLKPLEKAIIVGFTVLAVVVLFRYIIAGIVLLSVPGLVIAWLYSNHRSRREAEMQYQEALEKLRQQPKNAQLRNAALQAGRSYYGKMRGSAITIYDEQAITNDLSTIIGTESTD